MTAKILSNSLIGSTLLHIALFILVTNMSPTAPVAMRPVEAFLVESTVARLPESTRSIPPKTGADIQARIQETVQLQPARPGGGSASPVTDRKPEMAASPSDKAPDPAGPSPAQSTAPATAAPTTAPTSPGSVAPREENSGSKPSLALRPNSGTGKVMVLGDYGSPRFIHKESPAYPFMARKLGKEGKVVLRLALDAQGQLQGIDTVEANGFGFAEAAASAIRKSTFAPALRNGRAISSQVLVPVRFVLHEGQ